MPPLRILSLAAGGALALAAPRILRAARARRRPVADLPRAVPGVTEIGIADDAPHGELGVRLATPPIETPGPSVPAPLLPESETEREEWADYTRPDPDLMNTRDQNEIRMRREESAAAAEARLIGGPNPRDADDPRMEAVYEAGGGEQDGWEQAERDLIDNASHGDGHGDPYRDMLAPEAESDRSTAEYGEADEWRSAELDEDEQEPGS
jgi:hypothetical protein